MSTGGPFEHRFVTMQHEVPMEVCIVCGYIPSPGHTPPGCPMDADLDHLRAHPGRQLTSAGDAEAALADLRRIWEREG